MIQHYLKTAIRNMLRQKLFTSIKIGGFAIGIAACLLIALLVRNELSYDKQYPNAKNIVRIVGAYDNNGTIEKDVSFPAPMAKAMREDFPEVEAAGRLMPNTLFKGAGSNQLRRIDQQDNTYEEGFSFADQELLDILEVKMVYGDRKKALAEPFSMVISKSKADKYFPNQDPVGKLMYFNNQTNQPIKIGGVMEDFPANSHLQYKFLISLNGVKFWDGEQETWQASNYAVYLALKPGTDLAAFQKKATKTIIDKYVVPVMKQAGNTDVDKVVKSSFLLMQPIEDIHLRSHDISDWDARGDIRFVWLFAAIAGFILLIACINFLNLSTARSANRAKEVGLRKVIGSQRSLLVGQFLTESLLYSYFSFVIAIILAWALLPFFNEMSGKSLRFPWNEWRLFPLLFLAATFIGLLAGLYPSFYLSSFKPIQVLKGNLSLGSKNTKLRSTLVVFQFATTIILLIGTAVVYQQMKYIMNKKLGFDKDQVVMIQGTNTLGQLIPSLKNELLKIPNIASVSVSDFLPVAGTKRNGNGFWKEGKEKVEDQTSTQIWAVDDDYIKTLGLNLVAGRNFSKTMPTDSQTAIINKSMAEKLGLSNPIGERITNGWAKYTVIGLVEDFHFESMKQKVEPVCLVLGNSNDIVSVKVNGGNMQQTMAAIKNVWKTFSPNQAMRYSFMDEQFAAMYKDVERTGTIFTSFAVLAIIVACLGLFALAAFMAEQRRKEIGIRKVVGASVPRIVTLLSKDFLILIMIAFVIAAPLAWWGMTVWLQDFSYRAPISWGMLFALAALVAVLIGFLTVSSQAIKAAIANPVDSLRTE